MTTPIIKRYTIVIKFISIDFSAKIVSLLPINEKQRAINSVIKNEIKYFFENPFLLAVLNKPGRVPIKRPKRVSKVAASYLLSKFFWILLNRTTQRPAPLPTQSKKLKFFFGFLKKSPIDEIIFS